MVESIQEGERKEKDTQMSSLERKMEEMRLKMATIKQESAKAKAELAEAYRRLQEANSLTDAAKTDAAVSNSLLQNELDHARSELRSKEQSTVELEALVQEARAGLAKESEEENRSAGTGDGSSLQAALLSAREALTERTVALADREAEVSGLQGRIEKDKQALNERTAALTDRETEVCSLSAEVSGLKGRLQDQKQAAVDLRSQLQSIQQQLQQEKDAAEKSGKDAKQALNDVVSAIQELERVKQEAAEYKNDCTRMRAELEKVREAKVKADAFSALEVDYEGQLQSLKATREAEQSDARREIAALNSRVEELKVRLAGAATDVEAGKTEAEHRLQSQRQQLEGTISVLREELDEERKAMEDRKLKMKSYVGSLSQEKEELLQRYQKAERDASAEQERMRALIQRSEKETAAAKDQVLSLDRQLKQAEQALKNQALEMTMMQAELSAAPGELAAKAKEAQEHLSKRLAARNEVLHMAQTIEAEQERARLIDHTIQYALVPKVMDQVAQLERLVQEVEGSLQRLKRSTPPGATITNKLLNSLGLEEDLDHSASHHHARSSSDMSRTGLVRGIEMTELPSVATDKLSDKQLSKLRQLEAELEHVASGIYLVAQTLEQYQQAVALQTRGICTLFSALCCPKNRRRYNALVEADDGSRAPLENL
jgi:chromosome segregation ATPase